MFEAKHPRHIGQCKEMIIHQMFCVLIPGVTKVCVSDADRRSLSTLTQAHVSEVQIPVGAWGCDKAWRRERGCSL